MRCSLAICFAVLLCCPLIAQDEKGDDKADKKTEDAKPKVMAIVGGDVHTVTGPVVRKGTILVEDGKIKEIGQSIEVPEDATVIDATGKVITPGFVAVNMSGVGLGRAPSGKEKLVDGLNPFDRNLKYALGVGITSGCINLAGGRGRFGRRSDDGTPREIFPGLEEPVEEFVTERFAHAVGFLCCRLSPLQKRRLLQPQNHRRWPC